MNAVKREKNWRDGKPKSADSYRYNEPGGPRFFLLKLSGKLSRWCGRERGGVKTFVNGSTAN